MKPTVIPTGIDRAVFPLSALGYNLDGKALTAFIELLGFGVLHDGRMASTEGTLAGVGSGGASHGLTLPLLR